MPRSYGNVVPCLHLAPQLGDQTHLCFIIFMNLSLSLHFLSFLFPSSPLSGLILLATCSGKLLCAPIMGNIYVYRYGSFWCVSMHALETLKSFTLLYFPDCVQRLSLLLSSTVAKLSKIGTKKEADKDEEGRLVCPLR